MDVISQDVYFQCTLEMMLGYLQLWTSSINSKMDEK